jgi:hypothetical protein
VAASHIDVVAAASADVDDDDDDDVAHQRLAMMM